MMPSPEPGASHGRTEPPERVTVGHLVCSCQRRDPRIALCGLDVTGTHAATLLLPTGQVQACVVCLDLARTVLVARRCQRCPR
jgi:hypothetical protein